MTNDIAKAGRDEGMRRAAEHAEKVNPGWVEQAYSFLATFVKDRPGDFLAEDVRLAAALVLPEPPDNRAWGPVFKEACRRGLIQRKGYGAAKTGHMRPMPIWAPV